MLHLSAAYGTPLVTVTRERLPCRARIGGDQLTAQGLSFDQPRNVFAITGGTGRWRNAGGQVVAQDVSDDETAITLFISDLG